MLRKMLWLTAVSVLVLINFTLAALAQDNELTGRVIDQNRAAVSGATVAAKRADTRFEQTTQTDANGDFRISNLGGGNYLITVSANRFALEKRSISIGKTNNVEFSLKPEGVAEYVAITSSYLAGTPEELERTAGSISIIDKETLEKARVFNFSEALRKVSGVNIRDEEGFGLRPNIGIRGTNPTRSTRVLLLEDGLPLSYAPYGDNASYYHPPVERFDSIEVLKGAGQIAFGPVTVAGVVNYITPNPPENLTFSLKLIGGNRDYFNGSAGFGGTFGKIGVILNFTLKQGRGARDNVRLGVNDFSSKIVRQLNDKNILTFKYSHYIEDSQVTYSGLTKAEYAANPRANPFRNDSFKSFRTGLSLSHTIIFTPKASLTTNAYTNYFSRDWWRQSSNSNERPNRLGSDPDCLGLQNLNTTCGNQGRLRDYLISGIEPRFNLQFDLGTVRNDFNVGFRIHSEEQDRVQENGDLPNSRSGVLVESNVRQNFAYSGFIQNRFIWKNFSFTPGVRVENIKFRRINRLNNTIGETTLTQVIPGVGATFNVFKNTTVFAGVHRGFAPPATADIITNNGGVIDLQSELSWNYEVGLRTRPISGLSLEGTFFRTDYENQVIPSSLAGGTGSILVNGGQTLHQGFEFSAQLDSVNIFKTNYNIYFRTAYTLLETAEFRGTRFSTASRCANPVTRAADCLVTGNRLPYAPKNLLTSSVGYAYRNFDAFVENVYIGRQFADDLNSINPTANGQVGLIRSQIYWNATANYKVEKWKTTFFVTAKNIFDRIFIVDRARGILPSSPGLFQAGFKLIY